MNDDYPTTEEALAAALDWAINVLAPGASLESINFGRRRVDRRGYYFYAVTYQRWQNGILDGIQPAAETERTNRIRAVAAAWAAELWAGQAE